MDDSDLENPRSRSWVWTKGKDIQSAQYPIPINSLPLYFTSIRPTIHEIQLFWNLTLKHPWSRSWVRSKVKVTYYTQYPTDALPFVSHQSDQPLLRYGQNNVWPWKNTSNIKQGKSEGFDSCDRPSNLAQIWSKSSIFQPVWPWNLMYDLEK